MFALLVDIYIQVGSSIGRLSISSPGLARYYIYSTCLIHFFMGNSLNFDVPLSPLSVLRSTSVRNQLEHALDRACIFAPRIIVKEGGEGTE